MSLHNLSIKAKLITAFAVLALLVVAVAALSVKALSREHASFSKYVNTSAARATLANSVLDAANARAVAVRNLVLVASPADQEVEKAATGKAHERVGELLKQLQAAIDEDPAATAQEKQLFDGMAQVEAKYGPVALGIFGKAVAGDKETAIKEMDTNCRPLLAQLVKSADAYISYVAQGAKAEVANLDADYVFNRNTMLVAGLLAVAAAVGLALAISRAIVDPLLQAVRLATAVAAGDLRSSVEVKSQDEVGDLLRALTGMNDSLADIVSRVRQSSESIATGSSQIAMGNADLSSRTEQQASSLQQTAASMEEMNATAKNSADVARQATLLAASACQAAEKGGSAVAEVVNTMDEITASSRRISDIIAVIDGIAFQTNILALNAAVEAARAGEQGRGFAVVAGEVRSLAQRSAEAAKEIKTLIGTSVEKVEIGTKLVAGARSTMDDIVGQVKHVSDLISEIGTAAADQTSGIGQVNVAVTQLDQTTQQNAALVEESAAAAESLRVQAMNLTEAVAVFKTRQTV